MNDTFDQEKTDRIRRLGSSAPLHTASKEWIADVSRLKYSYNFTWLGRPIIQFPQDLVAMQEIIWRVRPDLIIEMGVARGGSLIFYASMLELIGGAGRVLGVDIDIRSNNRDEIERHSMAHRIDLLEGSSTEDETAAKVRERALGKEHVLVVLDSNHTHDHVVRELELYAGLVTKDSYLVVFDTIIEDMPDDFFPDRSWGKGNNPKTAVWEYLRRLKEEGRKATDGEPLDFEIDKSIENKLLITVAPDGYLKRI